jgi:hypothetical protein
MGDRDEAPSTPVADLRCPEPYVPSWIRECQTAPRAPSLSCGASSVHRGPAVPAPRCPRGRRQRPRSERPPPVTDAPPPQVRRTRRPWALRRGRCTVHRAPLHSAQCRGGKRPPNKASHVPARRITPRGCNLDCAGALRAGLMPNPAWLRLSPHPGPWHSGGSIGLDRRSETGRPPGGTQCHSVAKASSLGSVSRSRAGAFARHCFTAARSAGWTSSRARSGP